MLQPKPTILKLKYEEKLDEIELSLKKTQLMQKRVQLQN